MKKIVSVSVYERGEIIKKRSYHPKKTRTRTYFPTPFVFLSRFSLVVLLGVSSPSILSSECVSTAFLGFAAVSYHSLFEDGPGPQFRCRLCSKQVTNKWHHFHRHQAVRSVCPICRASYSRRDTLKAHIRTKHPFVS